MKTLLVFGVTIFVASFMLFNSHSVEGIKDSLFRTLNNDEININQSTKRRLLATASEYEKKVCADEGFDTASGALFDSKDEDRYKKNRNKLIKGDDSVFKNFVIESDTSKAISTAVSSYGLPVVLMLLFIVFSYPIGYMCYFCCACMPDKWCPPCKCCCKKCLCIQCSREEPYAGFSKLWPIVGMFVFLGWMAIAAIVGLAYTSGIEDSFKKFRCSTINFLFVVNNGTKEWGGVDNMYKVMTDLKGNLSSIQTTIGTNLQGCQTSTASPLCISSEQTALDSYFTTNVEWDYSSTTTIKNFQTVSTTTVGAILNTNGQYLQNPKLSGGIKNSKLFYRAAAATKDSVNDQLMNTMKSAVNTVIDGIEVELNKIEGAADSIKGNSFGTAIDSGITAIQEQQKFMNDQIESLYDLTEDPASYMSLLTTILNAIFGAFLGLSILVAVVGALMVSFNWFKLRLVLHLCWALFTLVTLISMLIALILYGLSIVGFGGCDYVGYDILQWDDPESTTRSPEWETLNDKIFKLSGDSKEIAEACFKSLGGTGDIFTPLGIKGQLDNINTISDFTEQQKILNDNLDGLYAQIQTILGTYVKLFSTSKVTIGGQEVFDHEDLEEALTTLNTQFNNAATYSQRFYATNIDNVSTNVDFNLIVIASQTRIWIGDLWKYQPSKTKILIGDFYLDSQADERVQNIAALSDTLAFDTVFASYEGDEILKWRDGKDVLARRQLNAILNYENQFKTTVHNRITTAFGNINTALNSIKTKIAAVTDPKTGLLGTDNKCFFLGDGIDNTLKSMCWGFFPSLYLIAESLIFIAVGMGMSSFFLCCTAMRYSKNLQLLNRKNNQVDSVKTGGG